MKPQKAYIIRISSSISQEYALTAAQSCEDLGIPYEFFEGTENKSSYNAWMESGIDLKPGSYEYKRSTTNVNSAACCTVSHARLWKQIYERQECAIVLEHDAIMLHRLDIDIPDNMIVVLGFKLEDPTRYDHASAGPSKKILKINKHQGSHAYAITHNTAKILLDEIFEEGVRGVIDNVYFMRSRTTSVPLSITDPTCAIGWLRESTIFSSTSSNNYEFTNSFKKHLK